MQGDKLTVAAVGDCQIATHHSTCQDKAFLDLVKIIRDADVGYANLEHLIHDYGAECYPVYKMGGTFTRAPPYVVDEFKWMGVDMMSAATNHAFDYMAGGIKETVKNMKAGGLPCAGIGENLAEARAPTFVDSAQGRVGLISVAIGSELTWMATDQRRDLQGKPGINLLRAIREYTLDPQTFKTMKDLVNKLQPLGLLGTRGSALVAEDAKEFNVMMGQALDGIMRTRFALGDKLGASSIGYKKDVDGNIDIVDDAMQQADWVFVACHHHITDGLAGSVPARVTQDFAHTCLDAGADGFLGNGPHQIQGIEIYKGRPIVYGLPDFIQQRDLMPKSPQFYYETFGLGFENTPMDPMDTRAKTTFQRLYQDTVHAESGIAVLTFEKHKVVDMKLHPCDLGFQKPRWQFGRPKVADKAMAEKIIGRWAKLSEPFGTRIDYKDGVGIVKIP